MEAALVYFTHNEFLPTRSPILKKKSACKRRLKNGLIANIAQLEPASNPSDFRREQKVFKLSA